jgi:hypothetical protein
MPTKLWPLVEAAPNSLLPCHTDAAVNNKTAIRASPPPAPSPGPAAPPVDAGLPPRPLPPPPMPPPAAPPGTQASLGLIIGAAAGGVGAVIVIGAIIWVCCKSRRARNEQLLQPAGLQDGQDTWAAVAMDQQQGHSGIAIKKSGSMPGKPDQASWTQGPQMPIGPLMQGTPGTAGTAGMSAGTAGMPGSDAAGLGAVPVPVVSGTISLVPLAWLAYVGPWLMNVIHSPAR